MLKKILCALTRLASPAARFPGFFAAVTLMCAVVPMAQMAVTCGRLLTLTVWALAQGAFLAWLMALALCLIKSRGARLSLMWAFASLIALRAVVEVGSVVMTESPVTAESAQLMLETDGAEAAGFFRQYFSWKLIAGLLCLAAAVAAAVFLARRAVRWLSSRRALCLAADFLLVAAVVWGAARVVELLRVGTFDDFARLREWVERNDGNQMLCVENQLVYGDPLVKTAYIACLLHLQNSNLAAWEELQRRAWDEPVGAPGEEKDFDIVIVVGESFVRRHTPLYGYTLPTTPRLCAEADSSRLAVYTDITSTANFTTASLRDCFSLNSISRGEDWSQGVYFPLLLRKGGWHLYHYDNQTVSYDSDMGIGRMFYAPFILSHVYDGVSDTLFEFDGDYLRHVDSRLRPLERPGRKAVIYHLAGQHFPFGSRYPGPGPFSAADITVSRPWLDDAARRSVAEYDNATHYNDSVLGAIIDSWRTRPAVLFYFSDHGEDVADLAEVKARNRQMPDDPAWIDRQYRVPFLVWISDSFAACFPAETGRLHAAASLPGTLDDFGHMLLGLTAVRTPRYLPARDLLSPSYTPHPRLSALSYPLDPPSD